MFAQDDYKRIAPLLEKHYVTVQQVDQMQTTVRVAEEASHQAASQLSQAQAQESMALASKQAADAGFEASQSKLGEAQHTVETLVSERPGRAAKVQQAELHIVRHHHAQPGRVHVRHLTPEPSRGILPPYGHPRA